MNRRILVVGAGGQMGGYYMNALLKDIGLRPEQIVAIDIDPEKIVRFKEKFPGVTILRSLDEVVAIHEGFLESEPTAGIQAAIVTTNTPSHHTVIVDLIKRGVKNIFTEKPLAMSTAQTEYILSNMDSSTNICTAFLINFSLAVEFVEDLMKRDGLYLAEAFVNWGKDRTGNGRPTPGDLEDESVHGIGVVHKLAIINQAIKSISLQARLSYLDYVNQDIQARAHEFDKSFPLPAEVNSSSSITEQIATDRGIMMVAIRSSYINIKQVRQMNLILNNVVTGKPEYLAEMNFDVKVITDDGPHEVRDILLLKKAGAKDDAVTMLYWLAGNKILDETKAFLDIIDGQEQDPRLTNFAAAQNAVMISDAVKQSHHGNKMVTVL